MNPDDGARPSWLRRNLTSVVCLGGVLMGCALWASWHAEPPAPPLVEARTTASPTPPPSRERATVVIRTEPGALIRIDGRPSGRTDAKGELRLPAGTVGVGLRYSFEASSGSRRTTLEFTPRAGEQVLPLALPALETVHTPEPRVGPCLQPHLGPCLSVPREFPPPEPSVGPCLTLREPSPGDQGRLERAPDRPSLLARFWDRLPPDLRERLGPGPDETA